MGIFRRAAPNLAHKMVLQYLIGWEMRHERRQLLESIIMKTHLQSLMQRDPEAGREAMAELAPYLFETEMKGGIEWIRPESAEEYDEELTRALRAMRESKVR